MYNKLFGSMFDGSLATRGPWEALVTFTMMLGLADKHGHVDITAEMIARRTLIPLDVIKKGIEELMKPDPYSRNPAHDGRRILPLRENTDWGWLIANFEEYHKLRTSDERAAYQRGYYQTVTKPKLAQQSQPSGEVSRGTQARGTTFEKHLELAQGSGEDGVEAYVAQMAGWCRRERPDLDAAKVFLAFRDHWRANANQRSGKKLDWEAAWRNWVRKEPPPKGTLAGPMPKAEKRTCDYCGAPRVGVTNGINHCREHANEAMDGIQPRARA